MQTYLSPGVYVEEVSSGIQPIAGISTSTAGFIGTVPSIVELAVPIRVENEQLQSVDGSQTEFRLGTYPIGDGSDSPDIPEGFEIRVDGGEPQTSGFTLQNDAENRTATVTFDTDQTGTVTADYLQTHFATIAVDGDSVSEPVLCTNFTEFRNAFGGFSTDANQKILAHAVFGFFINGGTRCYVVGMRSASGGPGTVTQVGAALSHFEAIDEIAIVAAPGETRNAALSAITTHCSRTTQDRFAIFDTAENLSPSQVVNSVPPNSNYVGLYYPWIQVFDPDVAAANPEGDGRLSVPPSGHIAGIYARVDQTRGVHKAPANEVVAGALGLERRISRNQQDGLNPSGINCIRDLNGNIRVWGARTLGGDANGEFKYINVRRTFLFLRESIEEGTQFTVFEPNTPVLWAQITRNVSAFLTNVWRSGALFGSTPQEAFFVKCDAETNPPEVRDLGQVITEIGVAIVRPAEFVIFRISQAAGQSSS